MTARTVLDIAGICFLLGVAIVFFTALAALSTRVERWREKRAYRRRLARMSTPDIDAAFARIAARFEEDLGWADNSELFEDGAR